MDVRDLKVGQEVTLYKYYLDFENNIKVEELDYYYVHEIKTEFGYQDFEEAPKNKYSNTTIITFYDKRENYYFVIPWNKVEINSYYGYEFKESENGYPVLYSLYNNDISLKAFINRSILALNYQIEHYKTQYEIMYKEYEERIKKINSLKSNRSE